MLLLKTSVPKAYCPFCLIFAVILFLPFFSCKKHEEKTRIQQLAEANKLNKKYTDLLSSLQPLPNHQEQVLITSIIKNEALESKTIYLSFSYKQPSDQLIFFLSEQKFLIKKPVEHVPQEGLSVLIRGMRHVAPQQIQ